MWARRVAGLMGVMLALAPAASPANHGCGSQIVIFSGIEPANAVNTHGALCLLAPDQHDIDTRLINPGSTYVTVRYTRDLGEGTATIRAVIDGPGFGFDARRVTLTRTQSVSGSWVYDSARLSIEPVSSGCLAAWLEGSGTDVTEYHSADSSCDSGPPSRD